MRIVYIGCVRFSKHCLTELLNSEVDIVGIVTRQNDGLNTDYADLSSVATKRGIPLNYCSDVNSPEVLDWIRELAPDVIFCFGWSQLIGTQLLSLTPMGILGAHPTLLPKNRGRHPIIWALAMGLHETGLTFFFMNEGADSGPILAQRAIPISGDDTASSLYEKVEATATLLIREFMPKLSSKNYKLVEQNSNHANYWRKRCRADGIIDWRMSAAGIFNLVRAITKPYPGAEFSYKGRMIKLWATELIPDDSNRNIEPGKVVGVKNGAPIVRCQAGAIRLLECEPEISLSVGDYLPVGDRQM